MMKYMLARWMVVSFLIWANYQFSFAQADSGYKIAFKDYHSVEILDIKLSQDRKYILTSDYDGKVLMFDAETFDFVQTIKSPGTIPVSGIQSIRQDSVLLMSQRYPLGFRPEFDTLVVKNRYMDTLFHKQQFSFQFIDLDVDGHFGMLNYDKDRGEFSLSVFNNNMDLAATASFGYPAISRPHIIAVSHHFEKIAYSPALKSREIIVMDRSGESQSDTITVPENEEVFSLFFDRDNHDLYALTSNVDEDKTNLYNLNSGTFATPVYTVDYYATGFDKVSIRYDGDQQIISVIHGTNLPVKPLVVIRNKDGFSSQNVDLPYGAAKAVINTERKEIIYVNQAYDKNIRDFSVYNYQSAKLTGTFPEATSHFYSGLFLPDNSWIALTTGYGEDIIGQDIKYFEAGTFNNRFGSLNFKNYLEVNHNLNSYYAKLIENKGIAVIYGNDRDSILSGYSHYYRYDFAADRISRITDTKLNRIAFQDYHAGQNMLLLGNGYYYNHHGQTEGIQFELVRGHSIIPVEGAYKFGKFANNGDYLLTISKDDLLEIRDAETLQTIYTKELAAGSYTLHSVDESTFLVSNSFSKLDMDQCNRETDVFEIRDGLVTVTNIPCIVYNKTASANNNVGYIVDDFGIGINSQILPFTKSDFPQTISFNNDGSKFILSFNNGKSAVYDTESLTPLGYMIHPDSRSHIFYDENNHYFSNIDPGQFLYALSDGHPIPLSQVEAEFFNPEKILELFGAPDQSYLTALQRALRLRQDHGPGIGYVADGQVTATLTRDDQSAEPNLYLLSIGVSDYQDPAYDLTLSDKDAMDMVKIYGHLDPDQTRAYYDQFFGTKYTLYNQDNEPLGTINNYAGWYNSGSYGYLLNVEGTLWLVDVNGEYAIWDYGNKTKEPIHLPVLGMGSTYDLGKQIFIKPDNSGFYLKAKDGVFEYLFETKGFNAVTLPFVPDKENFMPLNGNRWLHFDNQGNLLHISTGTLNSNEIDKTYTLQSDGFYTKINDIQTDGSSVIDSLYLSLKTFKTASADGQFVFFSTNDGIFFLDLHQNELIPSRLPIHRENFYSCEVSVDAEKKQLYVIESMYEIQEKHVTYYDFNGRKLDSLKFGMRLTNDGIVNNGRSYYYIGQEESLLSTNSFMNTDETLEKVSPFTFDRVYSEFIVNDRADSENIRKKLETFFSTASPNDQIMVFLAGHGVLDSNNNYYFAPYDMDFGQVDKNGISFQTIVQSLQKSPARNKLLLMDTCHSGRTVDLEESSGHQAPHQHREGDRGARVAARPAPRYKVSDVISTLFEDFLSTSGITIISASSGGDLAQEHPDWGNGAFTGSYIKILKHKMGGDFSTVMLDEAQTAKTIPLDDDFINGLYKEVINLTNGKQAPDLRELNKKINIYVW